MLVCAFFCAFCTRDRGVQRAPGIPCSLFEGECLCKARAQSVAGSRSRASLSVVIVREGGRSSIPEASVIEPRSRGVLDTPHARGTTVCGWGRSHPRHCEPTGRANARPMTGSAKQSISPRKERKQSISPRKERMDCFVAYAPRNDVFQGPRPARSSRQSHRFTVRPIQPLDLADFFPAIPHRGKQIQLR
jgi:hypothetical protein